MDGIRIATQAISTLGKSLDTTSNNIANLNTTGFKARSALLETGYGGEGVNLASTPRSNIEGPVELTGRSLDLAIEGDGLFAVRRPEGGLAFTRDGSFQVDGQGTLVTSNGLAVEPGISVPSGSTGLGVGRDGTVTAVDATGNVTEIGRIETVRFENPEGMLSIGGNLSVPTPASGSGRSGTPGEGGLGSIIPGALEASNVDIASEMVNLIVDSRAIEAQTAVVRTEDENLGTVLDMKG